ncbi:MAG TPA: hypothetical protein VGN15_02195 [Ktedonobacteraceae bacterium]|nr:hypothetical protein [Ktedonobacteraceae bacterium]
MTQYANQPNQPNQAGASTGSSNWSNATGVSDPNFNLVSILYHALQAAQTYDTYIRDAEQQGDNNLAQFLRQIQMEDRNRAQYAMQVLVQRVSQGAMR